MSNAANKNGEMLLPEVSYETYQLYAIAGEEGIENGKREEVFINCVLEAAAWLWKRYKRDKIPEQLKLPDPDDPEKVRVFIKSFSPESLTSFSLNEGYTLDIIWLPEIWVWTLRLIEPDQGGRKGSEMEDREAVSGRSFESNVAFRITEEGVECGFKTIVAEPEPDEGDLKECEVHRYSFIKRLAENKNIGLRQSKWKLWESAYRITSPRCESKLIEWIVSEKRMAPLVIVYEYENEPGPEVKNNNSKGILSQTEKLKMLENISIPGNPIFVIEGVEGPSKDGGSIFPEGSLSDQKVNKMISGLPEKRMGYAQFFIIPAAAQQGFKVRLKDIIDEKPDNGDVLIIDPKKFGLGARRFKYKDIKSDTKGVKKAILDYTYKFTKDKKIEFGQCMFLAEAEAKVSEKILNANQSMEKLKEYYEKEIEAIKGEHRREIGDIHYEIIKQEKERKGPSEKKKKSSENTESLKKTIEEMKAGRKKALEERDMIVDWARTIESRPTKPEEIPVWAEDRFAETMILHKRAQDCLRSGKVKKNDLKLVCDALEYLATEYFRFSFSEDKEKIGKPDRDRYCDMKYGRPFGDVTPLTDVTARTHRDYIVEYVPEGATEPIKARLDLHLRTAGDLRIYFFYDEDRKKIVIGYLPDHLAY